MKEDCSRGQLNSFTSRKKGNNNAVNDYSWQSSMKVLLGEEQEVLSNIYFSLKSAEQATDKTFVCKTKNYLEKRLISHTILPQHTSYHQEWHMIKSNESRLINHRENYTQVLTNEWDPLAGLKEHESNFCWNSQHWQLWQRIGSRIFWRYKQMSREWFPQ